VLEKVLSFFGIGNVSTSSGVKGRRKYVRHQAVNADVMIDGKKYIAYDWSLGGVSFDIEGNNTIKVGDKLQVIIKFNFVNNDITISQNAHVVRAVGSTCAAEFEPLPQPVRQEFDRVLETLYTQSFIDSQVSV